MPETRQLCTFSLDGLLFGVDVDKVQEVLRYQELTSVPLAPSIVRGLINLRGQIVLAIDLRRRLGLPERPEASLPMNVVVLTDEGPMSLLVDEIGEVLDTEDDAFERPPDTLKGVIREMIQSVCKLERALLMVLEIDRVVDFSPEDLGGPVGPLAASTAAGL